MAPHHGSSWRERSVSMSAVHLVARTRARPNRSACAADRRGSNRSVDSVAADRRRRTPSRRSARRTRTPVSPSIDASRARRRGRARPPAGRRPAPRAARCRSPPRRAAAPRGAAGTARGRRRRRAGRGTRRRGRRQRAQPCVAPGRVADDLQRHAGQRAGVDREVDPLVGHQRGHDQEVCRGDGRVGREETRCRRADTRRSPRDYSIGGSCPQHSEN